MAPVVDEGLRVLQARYPNQIAVLPELERQANRVVLRSAWAPAPLTLEGVAHRQGCDRDPRLRTADRELRERV